MAKKFKLDKTTKKAKDAVRAIDLVAQEADERFSVMRDMTRDQVKWLIERDEFIQKLLMLARAANDYNR